MSYSPDLISTALKMIASLAIVLGGMFVTFYFMKRVLNRNAVGAGNKLIRVLASNYIGVKKSISLVEVPGALLVLGITNDNISLLTKIENREIIDRITMPGGEKIQASFSDHLQKLSDKINTHKIKKR